MLPGGQRSRSLQDWATDQQQQQLFEPGSRSRCRTISSLCRADLVRYSVKSKSFINTAFAEDEGGNTFVMLLQYCLFSPTSSGSHPGKAQSGVALLHYRTALQYWAGLALHTVLRAVRVSHRLVP